MYWALTFFGFQSDADRASFFRVVSGAGCYMLGTEYSTVSRSEIMVFSVDYVVVGGVRSLYWTTTETKHHVVHYTSGNVETYSTQSSDLPQTKNAL